MAPRLREPALPRCGSPRRAKAPYSGADHGVGATGSSARRPVGPVWNADVAHAERAPPADGLPGSAKTVRGPESKQSLLRSARPADFEPLVPESASEWLDRLERKETYQRPDPQHAPTCFPHQEFSWIAPGASTHPFRVFLVFAADSVALPRGQECAQTVPGPCIPTLLVSEDARQARFAQK